MMGRLWDNPFSLLREKVGMRVPLALAILSLSLSFTRRGEAAELSGYAKTLDFAAPARENEGAKGLSGNRFRLEGRWNDRRERVNAHLISDSEVLWGTLLASQRQAVSGLIPSDELFELDWDLNEKENFLWRENLHRAYVQARLGKLEARAGRQRIAWGQGRLWNPTDAVNPYNPLSVERQERPGSDLGDLRWNFSALTFLETVYVPKRSARWGKSLMLARLKTNFFKTDLEFMGGKRGGENMMGAGHASQVFDGSFRSETAYVFDSETRKDFARAAVSYDRSFSLPGTLYLLGEYLYNGIGERSRFDYARVVLDAQDPAFLGREYIGFGAAYDLTALWKAECYGVINLSDGSAFLGPKLSWQAAEDFELAGGYQVFNGRDRTEYGNLRDVGFIQIQWFFSTGSSGKK